MRSEKVNRVGRMCAFIHRRNLDTLLAALLKYTKFTLIYISHINDL